MNWNSLDALMRPRSIAVIGASEDVNRYPGKVIRNLSRAGFRGRIFAVNPNRPEVMGHPCYPTIGAIPDPVDVALLLIPSRAIPSVLQQAIAAKVRAVIVYASGMAEASAEGKALQDTIVGMARDAGVRMLGPNCLGAVHVAHGTTLSGAAALERFPLIPGVLGVAAQSGGVMGSILDRAMAHGIGFSQAISTGNEADINVADCIGYMAEDEQTKAIALFAESIRDVPRFVAACELAAARGKPVVALKVGRSERGRQVALSHSAALLGDDRAYAALFRRLGVIQVDTLDDLFLVPHALVSSPRPRGDRVAVVAASGGLAGLSADICDDLAIKLPDFAPDTTAEIQKIQAGFGGSYNPLDITGQVVSKDTWWMVRRMHELLLADPNVDLVVSGQAAGQFAEQTAMDLISMRDAAEKPLLAFWTGRHVNAAALEHVRSAQMPVFEQPDACFRAVRASIAYAAFQRARDTQATSSAVVDDTRRRRALAMLAAAPGGLSEHAGKQLLALYGIGASREEVVRDAAAAVAAAVRIGFPVALKAHGAELRHKSDVDGVRLGLKSVEDVAAAFAAVTRAAGTGEALVAAMIPSGTELILGLARDTQVGLLLLVGIGGIFVEIADEVAAAVAPLRPGEAAQMLDGLRGAALLDGARGRPAADRAAVIAAIEGLSQLAHEIGDAIQEIDVNPLIAGPGGAFAADAVVVPRAAAGGVRS